MKTKNSQKSKQYLCKNYKIFKIKKGKVIDFYKKKSKKIYKSVAESEKEKGTKMKKNSIHK